MQSDSKLSSFASVRDKPLKAFVSLFRDRYFYLSLSTAEPID